MLPIRTRLPAAVVVLAVAFSSIARAQEVAPLKPPPPPETPAAPPAPPAVTQPPATPSAQPAPSEAPPQTPGAPPALTEPPPPPRVAPPMPKGFLDNVLTYDQESDTVRMGRQKRVLSRSELFEMLNRPDLVQKSHEAESRQRIYLITGGAVVVAGIATTIIALATRPDLNYDPTCNTSPKAFNVCAATLYRNEVIAGIGLGGGLALGALFATLAFASSPDVLTPDEMRAEIARHNAQLLKQMRDEQSTAPWLRITPYASARGGGLLTTFTF